MKRHEKEQLIAFIRKHSKKMKYNNKGYVVQYKAISKKKLIDYIEKM